MEEFLRKLLQEAGLALGSGIEFGAQAIGQGDALRGRMLESVAENLGISVEQLRAGVEAGEITADDVMTAAGGDNGWARGLTRAFLESELPQASDWETKLVQPPGTTGDQLTDAERYDLAQRAANGETLTEEEQALLGDVAEQPELDPELARMLAALEGQNDVPAWVYAPNGGRIYRQLTDEDLDSMIAIAIQMDDSIESVLMQGAFEGEDAQQTMRRNLTGFLLPSQSDVAQAIVQEWGIANEARSDDVVINGIDLPTVRTFSEAMGIGYDEASYMVGQANRFGIRPDMMAAVYNQRRNPATKLPDGSQQDLTELQRIAQQSGPASYLDPSGNIRTTAGSDIPEGSSGGSFHPDKISAYQTARKLKEGMDMYGDPYTAAVYASDPELAAKMYNNPWQLSRDELNRAIDATGGIAFSGGEYQLQWLQNRRDGLLDASGGQGESRDSEAARETARNMMADWNMPGLPDSVLDAVAAGWLGGARAGVEASLPNPFNPDLSYDTAGGGVTDRPLDLNTFVANHLRGLPQYQEFFANKGETETEVDYARRMRSQSQMLLGNSSEGDAAAQAGMRTGSIDTVGQNAILSGAASNSSTFQERLARLGEAFRQET